MTTYNTGNTVPSADARDRFDNSQTFDELMTGSLGQYLNRLGVPLKSWRGLMQQVTDYLIASGYESVYLTYGAGVVVERQTQLVQRAGELYRVRDQADIPLTLTGTWATDQEKLQAVGDQALRQILASPAGSGMVGYSESESYPPGSIGFHAKSISAIKIISGLVGDGVADDAAAINSAVSAGGIFLLPKPEVAFLVRSPIEIATSGTAIIGLGMYTSIIKKGFNGNAINITGNGCRVSSLSVMGEGATYSGGGINPAGFNSVVDSCRIVDTQDSPVIFSGSSSAGGSASAGTYAVVENCFLLPRDLVNGFAARSTSADAPQGPTARTFRNISGGGPLVDFSGMNSVLMESSFGTSIKFSAQSGKVKILSTRITSANKGVVVLGVDHIFDDNIFTFGSGFQLAISESCSNVTWGPSNALTVGDNTKSSPVLLGALFLGQPNNIFSDIYSYSQEFVWGGTTSPGAIGNSSVAAWYKLGGRDCLVSLSMIMGTTATVPQGTWLFRLPYKAYVGAKGVVMVKTSSGPYSIGVIEVQGGSADAVIYMNGATSALNQSSLAFDSNSRLDFSINYLVSP